MGRTFFFSGGIEVIRQSFGLRARHIKSIIGHFSIKYLNICVHGEFMGVRSHDNLVVFLEFLLNETV